MARQPVIDPYQFLCQTWQLLQGISAESSPELGSIGLYPRAFFLLAQIETSPYPAQLSEALLLPAPTVSFIVRQLEKARLITRKMDRSDLRRYKLTLTRKGREACRRGREILKGVAERRLSRLTARDQNKLAELLGALRRGENS